MSQPSPLPLDPLLLAHVVVFGAAAAACFLGIVRARAIEDADTRRGLVAFLATSGGWAAAHVAFFLVPSPMLKVAFYQLGLIIGISAVGPWLYFCSAFTGRSLHRASAIRWLAVAAFAAVVVVKLTNPLHGLYFQAAVVEEPFRHVAIENRLLHWTTMGFAYALATVGYFMLFERFWHIGKSTLPLAALVGVTGLPVVLDLVALTSPAFIELTYEPVGVAVFAVGVLFVYLEEFETVRLTGNRGDPVIVLDADDRIRETNDAATSLLPALAKGTALDQVLPADTEAAEAGETLLAFETEGGPRYVEVSSHPFATDASRLGRVLTLTDVTEREQYRRQLERQNERLERFASVVSHDLRNPLNVAQGRVELAREDGDHEDLERAARALDRMEGLIEDLLTLAREGQPIDETASVTLSDVAERCWEMVRADAARLTVASDGSFQADPDRLQQLLENLFRNAIEHGGGDVTITVGSLDGEEGFYVEDTGPGIPASDREQVFEFGYTTEAGGTGFGLSIVREIAEEHGWQIRATEGTDGGARFEVSGVDPS